MELADAQRERLTRAEAALDAWAEERLGLAGLSEAELKLGTADVSPSAREKLKGILKRLATKAHPFTTCMADLREHHPEWSDDRRKKTCNVLKALIGRKQGKATAMSLADESCAIIDNDVADLLMLADISALDVEPDGDDFSALTAKKRKSLPKDAFVFAGKRRYPIHDRAHGANALARAKGTPEYPAVKAAVCKRFSDLPACQESSS